MLVGGVGLPHRLVMFVEHDEHPNLGNLIPVLAAEIPSRDNGGLAADGRSVLWKLKRGVTWHDGQPFTADDCVFTWEFAKDPATAAVTNGVYKDVTVEGPPGAQLTARVTGISPVAGPKPLPGPGAKTEDVSPQPIS